MAKRKGKSPYLGDQLLAIYNSLACCGCVGVSSLVSLLGMGLVTEPQVKKDLIANYPRVPWEKVLVPQAGWLIAACVALVAVGGIAVVVGTWRGSPWALWLTLVFEAISLVATVLFGNGWLSAVLPAVVVFYCLRRLSGSLGPKR